MAVRFLSALVLVLYVVELVRGHGYMLQPPGRSSAWRKGFQTPRNVDDNGLNCGGYSVQHDSNKGNCGVCGDNYASSTKTQEPGAGNIYATGLIVSQYGQSQTVEVTTVITAYHKGYIEFRLCENNIPQKGSDSSIAVTQECLDKNLLKSPSGFTRFSATSGTSTQTLVLPAGISCEACVLQWRYRTGNSWGCEYVGKNYTCGLGFGPQEEFVNCADIGIGKGTNGNSTKPTSSVSTVRPTSTTTTQSSVTTAKPGDGCRGLTSTSLDKWCQLNCAQGFCPTFLCTCSPATKFSAKSCHGVAPYGSSLDGWCDTNCNYTPAYCPSTHCSCDGA